MWYQISLPPLLLIPLLVPARSNHTNPSEQKDVIVTYSNHAEAEPKPNPSSDANPKPKQQEQNVEIKTKIMPDKVIMIPEEFIQEKKASMERDRHMINEDRDSNQVVFIPNEREIVRNQDYFDNKPLRVQDIMAQRTVADAMRKDLVDKRSVLLQTDAPADIIFLSGKNNENEHKELKRDRRPYNLHDDARRSETTVVKKVRKLNCRRLNCNNTVDSVCGGKMERKEWKYRLFLNKCFFRKVNCAFRYEFNRYTEVPLENCQNGTAHTVSRSLQPYPSVFYPPMERPARVTATSTEKRSLPSRRSMTVSVDGRTCSHPCPASCPDDYEPQCAVSGQAQYKVFMNHCKLDYNSCSFNIVWHSRPLSACVGGKKAELQQNRAFIDWMQRTGIVDNKGRLVLS